MDSSGFKPKGRHPFASMNWIRFDGCYLSQADVLPDTPCHGTDHSIKNVKRKA